MGPHLIRLVSLQKGVIWTQRQTCTKRESHVKMKAEFGGMLLESENAKVGQQGRGWHRVSLTASERTLQCHDLALSASGTVRQSISVLLSYPVCGTLSGQP